MIKTKINNFIEDTFGNLQRTDIKLNGYSAFLKYMTFIYDDSLIPAILHVNGRKLGKDDNEKDHFSIETANQ